MEELLVIRRRLENHFSGIFRRIWVQRSTVSTQGTVLLTLFFSNRDEYTFVTIRNLRLITFEEILSRIENSEIISEELENMIGLNNQGS